MPALPTGTASVRTDVSEVRELARDLGKVPTKTTPLVDGVVKKGAVNVKDDWRERWSGIGHAPHLPRAISFDMDYSLGSIAAEIGPDKGKRQGALGNIIEFGTVKNAPIPGGGPALAAEEPKFQAALLAIAGSALG